MAVIALDYDGTYTVDPGLWNGFIVQATRRGHEVLCVSMRGPTAQINIPCRVVYTSAKAKVSFCEDAGIPIDIWIDDQPFKLLNNAGAL